MSMKKKILFVDHVSGLGHVNFNRIYIDALLAQGFDVKLALSKSLAAHMEYDENLYAVKIPDFYTTHSPLWRRVRFFLQLLYMKMVVNVKPYDLMFFSAYDELTFSLFHFSKPIYVVNHGNIRGLDNKLKKMCILRISRRCTQVVFNQYMKEAFVRYGIENVEIISHGCRPPFEPKAGVDLSTLSSKLTDANCKVLFFPSDSSADVAFLEKMLDDEILLSYLQKENILFVVKSTKIHSRHSNVLVVNTYLPQPVYQALFLRSDVVLIAYPESFVYRVSGVLFECLANGKNVLIKDIPALRIYEGYFGKSPFFRDEIELLEKLRLFVEKGDMFKGMVNLKELQPDFSVLEV